MVPPAELRLVTSAGECQRLRRTYETSRFGDRRGRAGPGCPVHCALAERDHAAGAESDRGDDQQAGGGLPSQDGYPREGDLRHGGQHAEDRCERSGFGCLAAVRAVSGSAQDRQHRPGQRDRHREAPPRHRGEEGCAEAGHLDSRGGQAHVAECQVHHLRGSGARERRRRRAPGAGQDGHHRAGAAEDQVGVRRRRGAGRRSPRARPKLHSAPI